MWFDMEGKTIVDCWEWAVLPLVSANNLAVLHTKCKSWKCKPWEGSQTVLCCHQIGEGAYVGILNITSQTA